MRAMASFSILLTDLLFYSSPLLVTTIFLLLLYLFRLRSNPSQLPPGPPGLPVIGNLHQLGRLPHRTFFHMSKKYGPLMRLKLGWTETLVASSPEAAAEIMKTQDLAFCSRPPLVPFQRYSYGGLDVAFAEYGELWKQARRLVTLEFFSPKRVQQSRVIRAEEVGVFVKTISESACRGGEVNLSEMAVCLFSNITFREVFGKRASEEGECRRGKLHDLVVEWAGDMGRFTFGDFFPGMGWLDVLSGTKGRMARSLRRMDDMFEREIEEHSRGGGGEECGGSFLAILLRLHRDKDDKAVEYGLTRDRIKALLMDMLIAATDSSASTIEWGLTELIRNPGVMKRAQDEVRGAIGDKGKVEEADLHDLHYLKFLVMEIFRLHPPAPLLLPRECIEDCTVHGFHVAAGTRVFISAWAMGRDPHYWDDPESFRPERFQSSPINYKGQHFQLIPFGSGRRICPGLAFGEAGVQLALANILYSFDWELPPGMNKEDVDMGECGGVVAHRNVPLVLVASPATTMR